jgi:putative glutamine amidotransferase
VRESRGSAAPRPLIAITADLVRTEAGRRLAQLELSYAEAVSEAGGLPLLVAPLPEPELLAELAARVDGLVLTGGDGLPASLDAEPGRLPSDLPPVAAERLQSELELYRQVRRRERPVLGVCLGMQLMNLEAGGTLHMDVARELAGAGGHSTKRGRGRHALRLLGGSELELWFREPGAEGEPQVGSWHLQAVDRVGAGLAAVAWADDGVVEAIEPAGGLAQRWLLGVQWHPERERGPLGRGLLVRLVEACRR